MRMGSKALLGFAILYVGFLYAPALLLPIFSFNNGTMVAFPLSGFTFRWYQGLFGNVQLIAAFKNSLIVAVAVATISTIIGILGAKAVTHRQLRGGKLATGLIMLPLIVPSIVIGISLLMLARYVLDIKMSLWTVGAGHVLLCMPFSMLVMVSRLEGFDKTLEEASLDLGQTRWGTFRRVTLPLALPGIVASFLLCLTVSCWPSSLPGTRPPCRSISSANCDSRAACPMCWRSAPASCSGPACWCSLPNGCAAGACRMSPAAGSN